jgi:hypothetical protein
MAAQVASLYVNVRALEASLQITHENAAIQKRSFEITEHLYQSGNDSELDVQQAKTQTWEHSRASNSGKQLAPTAECAGRSSGAPGDCPDGGANRNPGYRPGLCGQFRLMCCSASRCSGRRSARRPVSADRSPKPTSILPCRSRVQPVQLSLSGSPTSSAAGPGLTWNIFDYDRVENAVRVEDARYQQLAEVYRDTILQAARDVDSSAISLIKGREQLVINEEVMVAAQRALDIANVQYREGFSDFNRVLDAQRSYIAQSERVISNRSEIVLSLIALYKALGGGWEPGRLRPPVDEATRQEMQAVTNWEGMLEQPLPSSDLQVPNP